MKTQKFNTRHSARSGGAVIIVVITLLMVLVFLGLFIYNWTNQELSSAQAWGTTDPLELNPDSLTDFALEQVIVGTRQQYGQSVLEGSEHSMLAKILGRPSINPATGKLVFDASVRDGRGMLVSDAGGGNFSIDYNGDGAADANNANFVLNFSAAANGGTHSTYSNNLRPDVGYTYPDVNSMFLAFDEYVPGVSQKVVIPSFFRPQLFVAERGTAGNFSDIYMAVNAGLGMPNRQNAVFRPHVNHEALVQFPNGTWGVVPSVSYPRFISNPAGQGAASGDRTRLLRPFPFQKDLNQNTYANDFGIFTQSTTSGTGYAATYEYDVDIDRDGVTDSILMDLGHPLMNLAGGQQVVPIYAMKWIDGDGLLNVNAHGNLNGLDFNNQRAGYFYNGGTWQSGSSFSLSNLGVSSGEVNLGMALQLNPNNANLVNNTWLADISAQHRGMFGIGSGAFTGVSSAQLADMELTMLITGRRQFEPDGVTLATNANIPGRNGDDLITGSSSITQFWNNVSQTLSDSTNPPTPLTMVHPQPGMAYTDDDQDTNIINGYDTNGDLTGDVYLEQVIRHPIDWLGIGSALNLSTTPSELLRALVQVPGYTEARLPGYFGQWSQSLLSQYAPAFQGASVNPMNQPMDESDETYLDPALKDAYNDAIFDTGEMFHLHASAADRRRAGQSSRLLDLASVNLRDSYIADQKRSQLTTDSWDRLEFSVPYSATGLRSWEFNNWNLDATAFGLASNPPGNEAAFDRAFPPSFPAAPARIQLSPYDEANDLTNPRLPPYDPFRAAVRRTLAHRVETTGVTGRDVLNRSDMLAVGLRGQRLDLNRLLYDIAADGSPMFKQLTAQVPNLPSPAVTVNYNTSQEYRARLERQQMARDIYVLLYTFCGGNDAMDYTNTPGGTLYTAAQTEEMAQFAVNVVDAMDPDDVITLFEYDTNLADGWNLDDNPYQNEGGNRGLVYGVEAQTLTISEALVVHTNRATTTDNNQTEWDDTLGRTFLFVELRNNSPYPIDFSEEAWEVHLEAFGASTPNLKGIVLQQGVVPAGGLFTIGTTSDELILTAAKPQGADAIAQTGSRFRVDAGGGSDWQTVAPSSGTLNLDLIGANMGVNQAYYVVNYNGNTIEATKGTVFPWSTAELLAPNGVPGAGTQVRVRLRRKASLDREIAAPTMPADAQDNPWVEVDGINIDLITATANGGYFYFNSADPLAAQLALMKSRERPQPLHRNGSRVCNTQAPQPGTPSATWDPSLQMFNSIGTVNATTQALTNGYTLWQPHFDRPFTSKYDLMSIPLVGPDRLTDRFADGLTGPTAKMTGFYNPGDEPNYTIAGNPTDFPAVAGMKMRVPQPPMSSSNVNLKNRWYRLLEFVTVYPTELQRTERVTGGRVRRTAGQVNLNTLRHEATLAGLIDDAHILGAMATGAAGSTLTTDFFDNTRNWYQNFLLNRDGADPILAAAISTNIPIPGTPASKPYLSGAFVQDFSSATYDLNTENQLIRNQNHAGTGGAINPFDPGATTGLYGIFEARTASDVGVNNVDYDTRQRLLAKLANHATNRSHVFAGWIEVQFHEAHEIEPAPGDATYGGLKVVQVGAEVTEIPHVRMFVVVDMSRLEEAFDPITNSYDFRKFIIHRQVLP